MYIEPVVGYSEVEEGELPGDLMTWEWEYMGHEIKSEEHHYINQSVERRLSEIVCCAVPCKLYMLGNMVGSSSSHHGFVQPRSRDISME